MTTLDKSKVAKISDIISKRIRLLIINNSSLAWSDTLHQDAKTAFYHIFNNVPALVWDNDASELVTFDNIEGIYDALEPYRKMGEGYALGSLNKEQHTLLELSRISASYMVLLFIKDHYPALFDLCFDHFGDDLSTSNPVTLNERQDIALQIKEILDDRVHYVL